MAMSGHCTGEERYALYRFYDARETLLYVGITSDPWRRWREHVREKSWYPQVKHQSVTWYDTERQARKAEDRAIRKERPQFNIAGALRPPDVRIDLSRIPLGGLIVVCLCIPGACSGLARLVPALSPAAALAFLSIPVLFIVAVTVACTPLIYRFGCWMNLTFGKKEAS
jgi:predicted GIY-YIG superfamily endonuclease